VDSDIVKPQSNRRTKVAILMCTYNGQAFLREQVDSFIVQTCKDFHLWVSDDRSTDNTVAILDGYKEKLDNRLSVVQGPKQGFAENFLTLICNQDVKAEYYAYSDQDDIWHADKMELAVKWLETVPKDIPALYGARSVWIDEKNNELGLSNLFVGPFGFKNAIVQNVAAGNTMVFNQAACDLIREAGTGIHVAFHDWWTYIVIAGSGGKIFIDQTPVLRYRQHGNNVIGCNNGFKAKLVRLKRLLSGHMRYWNTQHIKALSKIKHRLSKENSKVFDLFATSRDKWLLPRVIGIYKSGIYRQTQLGNIALVIAAFLRKL
jgi:glycosyltransferase involved in cell wall biosynthesis